MNPEVKQYISLCLTNYNRSEMLYESFRQVINDPRLSEIIIVDDHSREDVYHSVHWQVHAFPKVKLYRNEKNLGCYRNKREAISRASNEWVILFDSDNIITPEYIDRIENLMIAGIHSGVIYQPSFAKPHFNFSMWGGKRIDKHNVSQFINDATFATMLNAMNYFVNRDEYLKVWQNGIEPWTADSIFQNYNWLKSGNSIYVVPGLEYEHRVHDGSHYREHFRKTGSLYNDIIDLLKQMR